MTQTKQKCRYCREGHAPKDDGNHWIVKSIIPAKINIVKCKDLPSRDRDNK